LTTFGKLFKALQFAYPEGNWDEKKISSREKKSSQRWLTLSIKRILPEDTEVLEYPEPYFGPS
jgi:hypothetical protein